MTEITEDIKEIKDLFRFHGITLPIVEHNGEDYIPIKPIVDVVGLNWKKAKIALTHEENKDFHHFCHLKIANLAHQGYRTVPPYACILLKTVEGYIINIDRGAVKGNGNIRAYEFLRALHKEWYQALHNYETHGVAMKAEYKNNLKDLFSLRKSAIGAEKEQLTRLIRVELAKVGDIDVADLIDPGQTHTFQLD